MTFMKKLCFGVAFALTVFSAAAQAKAQSKASAFTGAWVLDRAKTGTKDVPIQMTGYKMLVGESEDLLNVKSKVEGKVEVLVSRDRPSSNTGVGDNTAGRGATPSASGVSGVSSRSIAAEKPNYGGSLALFYTPNDVTYNLSGEEAKVEIKQGEKVTGIARIKAKVDKNGKSIQFSTVRRMQSQYGEVEVITRESWKLSDDGKSLKLQRTIDAPNARDQITLTLVRPAQ